jgi:hypothetical protein
MGVLVSNDIIHSNFSINSGCINKIPLNPPLQKREAVGMSGLIEKLLSI